MLKTAWHRRQVCKNVFNCMKKANSQSENEKEKERKFVKANKGEKDKVAEDARR